MDIINHSIKNRKRKGMKTDEELLTPVLSIVEEDSSLHNEEQVSLPSSLVDATIENIDEEDVQYEFKDEGVSSCFIEMPTECEETITCSTGTEPVTTAASETTSPAVQTIYNYPINGGIYLIGPASKVLDPITNAPRGVISRVHVTTDNSRPTTVCRRDDKRRATHNEVERRRRDKINNWILKLSKIIPECKQESSKGNFETQSKGGILAKACDYIMELRESNQRLMVFAKENEQLIAEVEALSREVKELRRENERLRAKDPLESLRKKNKKKKWIF